MLLFPPFCCCIQLTVTIPRAIKIFFTLRLDIPLHQTAHIHISSAHTYTHTPALNTTVFFQGILLFYVFPSRYIHGAFLGLNNFSKAKACFYVSCLQALPPPLFFFCLLTEPSFSSLEEETQNWFMEVFYYYLQFSKKNNYTKNHL
jgi:hypothetical protein